MIERLLKKRNMTKYRLAVEAGIPHATLNDITNCRKILGRVYNGANGKKIAVEYM